MRRRRCGVMVAALGIALGAGAPGRAAAEAGVGAERSVVVSEPGVAADVAAKFEAFCQEWMRKLAARERDNLAAIRWERSPSGGVTGAYTGYSQRHSCLLKAGTGNVPVGKIVYVETRYEKSGATPAEAQKSAPTPIEAVEVTEIFRYKGGKWDF